MPARVAICLLLILLSACQAAEPARQSSGSAPSGRASVQEFRFNIGGEPPAMDPQYASWDGSIAILCQLFTGLVAFDEQLQVVPAVARQVPSTSNGGISPDLKTYTFKLRDDVKWSDGQPVTAKDFAYGLRRLFDPDKGAEYASFYFDIVGSEAYFSSKGTSDSPRSPSAAELGELRDRIGVRAVDDQTLQIQLDHPQASFPQLAALWGMYPIREDVVERYGDRWVEGGNLIGNGPFKMTEWVHNSHITLAPNDFYFGQKPSLTKVTLLMVADAAADYAAYLNGQVDGVKVPAANVPQVMADETLKAQVRRVPQLATYALNFNTKRPPLDKREVRQAISQAIDRETLVQQVQRGVGKPAYSWIPPGMPGYQENLGKDVNKFDPAAAKKLLADAGYPDGRGLPQISLQYSTTGDMPLRAQFVQAQLKSNLGIDISLEPMEPRSFSRLMSAKQHDIGISGWIADYPDPDNWLPEIFGTGTAANYSGYSNPRFDETAKKADLEQDATRRLQLWGEAQELVVRDVPVAFLIHDELVALFKPNVQGLKFTAMDGRSFPGRHFLSNVWIAGS